MTADVLVVGAGLAGARMCQRLRAEGFAGRVVLVGAEPDAPYDRPPLTTDPGTDTDLGRTMGIDVRDLADDVLLGRRAVAAEPAAPGRPWTVSFEMASESALQVDASVLVAASGASPLLPLGWESARLLHTRRQAAELWQAVADGTELVVVGGGWIGCEVGRTAARRGARVRLLEAAEQLLPGRVPSEAAARLAGLLEAGGVVVRVGAGVDGIATDAAGRTRVHCAGEVLVGDLVLAALGVRPETAWLPDQVSRSRAGAVLTDAWGRGSLPGLFAAGDAAARWSPRVSRHLPGGHWTEAFACAESVAPAVVSWLDGARTVQQWADPPPTHTLDPVPYTFSDLGDQRLLVVGDAAVNGSLIWRDLGNAWTVYVVDDSGRLAGVAALDRPRDVVAARKAMRTAPQGRPEVDVAALADPAAPPARCFPASGSRSPAASP